MGIFDSIMGRSKPVRPDLDNLFGLPSAAITLEAAAGFTASGSGAVAFRPAEGRAFAEVQQEVQDLLAAGGGPPIGVTTDEFGYTWLTVRTDPPDVPTLVTGLHAVNSTLQDTGFGPSLLCTVVGFLGPRGQRLALVYLFKQGSFYPFVPDLDAGEHRRDNITELKVRDLIADDVAVERDLTRWFALWGAPGLDAD